MGNVMVRQSETLLKIGLFRSLDATRINRLDSQCSWRRASPNEWIIDYQDETFSAVGYTLPGKRRRDIFTLAGVLRGNVTIRLERG